jgi:HAMP domain-containing protein
MDALRDIHGIDPAPWWPPATGWWLVLLMILLSGLLAWWFWQQRRLYPLGRWQKDARRRLQRLRQQLKSAPTKQLASELSELLRRIRLPAADARKRRP